MTARCIYCLQGHEEPFDKAHVFPESVFGDHEYLFLSKGEVCHSCNNVLSRLEKKFQSNLSVLPLMVGPGFNKKGKPTTIDAAGLRATRDPRDPRIVINLGTTPYRATDGQLVRPAKKPEGLEVIHQGQDEAGHHFQITHSFRLVIIARMLAKIAFETLCFEQGPVYCCDPRWDKVRAFILKGVGPRTCAVPKEWSIRVGPDGTLNLPKGIRLAGIDDPEVGAEADHYWIAFIGIGAPFAIDLSPENVVLARFFEKQPGAADLAQLVTFGAPSARRRKHAITKNRLVR